AAGAGAGMVARLLRLLDLGRKPRLARSLPQPVSGTQSEFGRDGEHIARLLPGRAWFVGDFGLLRASGSFAGFAVGLEYGQRAMGSTAARDRELASGTIYRADGRPGPRRRTCGLCPVGAMVHGAALRSCADGRHLAAVGE